VLLDSGSIAAANRRSFVFREKIAQQYDRLGRNQKRIADFLTHDYREAAFMNGSALSERLDVDPATVTRFAQRLGYSGYPELLGEIQELVKQEIKEAYG
jgi:DNA-binding MurR/RpiR family transcriptional regulator